MLRQVFQSQPIKYLKEGDPEADGSVRYATSNYPPYIESLSNITGLTILAPGTETDKYALPGSPASIYLWASLYSGYWPSWSFGYYRYNAVTGVLYKKFPRALGGQTFGSFGSLIHSRNHTLWIKDIWGLALRTIQVGATAEALVDEEPKVGVTWSSAGVVVDHTHFEGMIRLGNCVIDEKTNTFISFYGREVSLYAWSSGKFYYTFDVPSSVVAVCLEDNNHVYMLLDNRTLMLYDYVRGEVLGAAKLPKLIEGGFIGSAVIQWDPYFRRILVAEQVPDNPDGSGATCVRGYRLVPEGVRITMPIPLKAPRRGRTIPVLTQVVGDANEGVGGYVVQAQVSGDGLLAGLPVTNHWGEAIIPVLCGRPFSLSPDAGSEIDTGSLDTGSVDLTTGPGVIRIDVSANIYAPDPADIPYGNNPPISSPDGGGTVPGGTPGGPGGGTDPGTNLPATAPNMTYIMDQVYASRVWNLSEAHEDDANGRGAFIEACVTAMHDVDPRFGHVDKNPGQNQYNGHAVDAINFKCDDGVTAEIYDVVSGSSGDYGMGGMSSRSTANLEKWKYPA